MYAYIQHVESEFFLEMSSIPLHIPENVLRPRSKDLLASASKTASIR